MNVPWPSDPLRLSEPTPTVELLDGSRLELTIVPLAGFAWDDWPAAHSDDEAAEAL